MKKNKAQRALAIANEIAKDATSSIDFHNAFFGIGGKFGELFPTLAERRAFSKTDEYQQIRGLRAALARIDAVFHELDMALNGASNFGAFGRKDREYLFLPADKVVDEFLSERDSAENDLRSKLIEQLLKSPLVKKGNIRVPRSSRLGKSIVSSSIP